MTNNAERELLPCPFCGGNARSIPVRNENWEVQCMKCGAHTRVCIYEQLAASAWQARAQASGVPDDKSMHGLQPIETAPEESVIVVAWIDEDGCTQYEFEWLQDGSWHEHNERYDHYLSCAPRDIPCTGPSENAPYTHWLPLPILHASDSKEVPAKESASVPVERLEALQNMFETMAPHLIQSQEACYQYAAMQIAELIAEYKA